MAAVEAIAIPHTASTFNQSNPLEEFTDPRERLDVPNHLLDTKLFNKISQNSTTKVEPSIINFAGYRLNKVHKRRIKLCNSSAERQNLHIIPPASKYFSIKYTKPRRFVPGFTIDVVITFVPDEWRYYFDCIRLHCKGEENLIVPIHAFPVMDTSKFPRKLVFLDKNMILGQSYSQDVALSSDYPVEFEFQIAITQSHPSFEIFPLSGVVPGQGKTSIHVVFTPVEYVTAHMSMQLAISQFNSKPLICDVTASCQPPSITQLAKSVKDFDELYKQTKLLDPRAISPVQIARRRQKIALRKSVSPQQPLSNTFVRDGYQFPSRVHTQFAVNKVLLQEKGKLKMKDLREVLFDKANASNSKSVLTMLSVGSTPQMKEAAFEMIARQDAMDERANQLRWQVRLGDVPMIDEDRTNILKQREMAAHYYKYEKQKNPDPEQEIQRLKTKKGEERSWRRANQIPAFTPAFDPYKNNPWSCRHRGLERFQQAARKILIRCRAQKKAVIMRDMIEEYKKVQVSSRSSTSATTPFQVKIHDRGSTVAQSRESQLLTTFIPENVRPFTFPVYVSPDTKEDIAPDALGLVPLKPTEVNPIRHVPYHDLVVPKYYQITGYDKYDVTEAVKNYVPPNLARPLRSGAEDEIIKVTLPSHLLQSHSFNDEVIFDVGDDDLSRFQIQNETDMQEDTNGVGVEEELIEESASSTGLIPPPGLFKNPTTHKLQIFNRAPGVIIHYLPLSQNETDKDSLLSPIPKPTMMPGGTKLLDRKDVIKGVMGWKKFSSHGLGALAHTSTLMDIWLPRWSDVFSQAMMSSHPPKMLATLPEDDAENIAEEGNESRFPLLTTEMIKENFATEDDLNKENEAGTSEESLKDKTSTLSNRPSIELFRNNSKDLCQLTLETLMSKKYDNLGSQIRDRLYALELEFEKQ